MRAWIALGLVACGAETPPTDTGGDAAVGSELQLVLDAGSWDGHHFFQVVDADGVDGCYTVWHAAGAGQGWDGASESAAFSLALTVEDAGTGEVSGGDPCVDAVGLEVTVTSTSGESWLVHVDYVDGSGATVGSCDADGTIDAITREIAYESVVPADVGTPRELCSGGAFLLDAAG